MICSATLPHLPPVHRGSTMSTRFDLTAACRVSVVEIGASNFMTSAVSVDYL
jgi:hypothetical protein